MAGRFKIIISPNGSKISVDVEDVIGTSCVTLTKVFAGLGSGVEAKKKAEYYMETEDKISVSG